MRNQSLFTALAQKKKKLLNMGENIRSYKRQTVALQNKLSATKDGETKALVLQELQKLSRRLVKMKKVYRYCHVAYSELRGTPRSRIEKHTPYAKKLDERRIASLK